MVGNVKEWVWNSAGSGRRYLLGGAWDEPEYMAIEPDAREPWDRGAAVGFRCAKFDGGDDSAGRLGGTYERPDRDIARETPADDSDFAAYRRFYTYDPTDLQTTKVSTDASPPDWTVESIRFRAAYGGDVVPARVYVPKRGRPPYQAIVWITGAGQFSITTSNADTDTQFFG